MKRKSLTGFILGLIGGIGSVILGLIYIFIITLGETLLDIFSDFGANVSNISLTPYVVFAWLGFLGAILAIVGASMCFSKARVGGILLGIATVMVVLFPGRILLLFGIGNVFSTSLSGSLFVLWFVPSILILTGAVLALIAKPKDNASQVIKAKV